MEKERIIKYKTGKKQFITMALIFFLGLTIFLYPIISNFINSRTQSYVIETYNEETKKLNEDEKIKILKKALEYNRKLKGGTVVSDPFDEAIPQQSGLSYLDLLNIGEVMGYIEIPRIDVNLPIYHGTSDDVLKTGIGHIEQTSLPVGGESTNSVLTGHRGLPEATMFRHLNKMELEDIFYIHSLDNVLAYKVFDIEIVIPSDIEKLKIEDDRDLVTLITCDPYMINTNRLLVRGERIKYNPPVEQAKETNINSLPNVEDSQTNAKTMNFKPVIIGICIGLVVLLGWFYLKKIRIRVVKDHEI